MTNATDQHIDRLLKARWLAIGLSQSDLAEVLDAAFKQTQKDANGSNGADTSRLMQIAEALDIPVDFFCGQVAVRTSQEEQNPSSAETFGSLHSLLELRLLRAFHELSEQRTKRLLVHLAEQIVKRQANRRGHAG
jgi:transcriptional regulator with XRE-family HTH domain